MLFFLKTMDFYVLTMMKNRILDSEPSDIAEKLGIDSYVVEIIHKETKKAISKINPDLLLSNR